MAGTGVVSLCLCVTMPLLVSLTNQNVLYITCEMAEERIAERIDANLMDITLDELASSSKDTYEKKVKNATVGMSTVNSSLKSIQQQLRMPITSEFFLRNCV